MRLNAYPTSAITSPFSTAPLYAPRSSSGAIGESASPHKIDNGSRTIRDHPANEGNTFDLSVPTPKAIRPTVHNIAPAGKPKLPSNLLFVWMPMLPKNTSDD